MAIGSSAASIRGAGRMAAATTGIRQHVIHDIELMSALSLIVHAIVGWLAAESTGSPDRNNPSNADQMHRAIMSLLRHHPQRRGKSAA